MLLRQPGDCRSAVSSVLLPSEDAVKIESLDSDKSVRVIAGHSGDCRHFSAWICAERLAMRCDHGGPALPLCRFRRRSLNPLRD